MPNLASRSASQSSPCPFLARRHTLAFPPIEAEFASTTCGASKEAQEILAKNVNGDEGEHGLPMGAFKPGPQLDDMNLHMIQEIARALDTLQPAAAGESSKNTIGLYAWLRDAITTATTCSVCGPMSPYDDNPVADALREFESGLMSILVGFLPSLTVRNPIAACIKFPKAFEAYYRVGGVEKASALAKFRYEAKINNGVSIEDIARYEVGGSITIMVNTAPAAFWTLLLLFSHPGLVGEIRQEIDACVETGLNKNTKIVHITTLKSSCPLFLSTHQEVLDQWLLKKGAMLQMPSRVIHHDPARSSVRNRCGRLQPPTLSGRE